jgi:predicted transcriptional regulator
VRASLLSVRPKYVDQILTGQKTIELRRQRPRIEQGHAFFLYASSPIQAVAGVAQVCGVEIRGIGGLWKEVSARARITRAEFSAYFDACERGVAIHLASALTFARPLTLHEIRNKNPSFHPPRTWTSFSALPWPLQGDLIRALQTTSAAFRGSLADLLLTPRPPARPPVPNHR